MGKFRPLTLKLVDEGRFVKDVDGAISEVVRKLIAHSREYKDGAIGAKAVVNMALTIKFEGRDENDFSIKGQITTKMPAKPACVTMAMADKDDAGDNVLFVRASGSTDDSPAQGVLTTKDGQVVDRETGEVKGAKVKESK